MVTIWAVRSGETETVFGEEQDVFICFFEDERDKAEKFADEHNEDVHEWTVAYRDLCELRFREE